LGVLLTALALLFTTIIANASPASSTNQTTIILVVGAAGEAEFGSNFVRQATLWQSACHQAGCREITLGIDEAGQTNDFETLKQTLATEPKESPNELWLVLIGHGTFDGKEARFNLRGPDVSATELAVWLQPFRRPLAVINTSSSSAPFLNKLSATNRVVITATRSGNEQNFSRFGRYLAETIGDPEADLDKDGQVSLLEAFLMASRRTSEFYKTEGRIITEHALLDDSGDGLGTPADWFRGLRAVKRPKENSARGAMNWNGPSTSTAKKRPTCPKKIITANSKNCCWSWLASQSRTRLPPKVHLNNCRRRGGESHSFTGPSDFPAPLLPCQPTHRGDTIDA
jgi:hypothetical protein